MLTLRHESGVTLSLAGELDLASADYLREHVATLLRAGSSPPHVIIDVAGLTFVDVAGVRALADAAARLAEVGGSLRLARASSQLTRLLRLLGLDTALRAR